MTAAVQPGTAPHDLEVRVLSGRLAGARLPVRAGRRLSIGPEFFHDLVLRDAGADGASAEIEIDANGAVRLRTIAGPARLLGMGVPPGTPAALPPFVPFHLGAAALAIGTADEARWTEAVALAVRGAGEDGDPTPAESSAPAWQERLARAGRLAQARGRAVLHSTLVLSVALGVIAFAAAGSALDLVQTIVKPSPAQAETRLHEAGFGAINLQENGDRVVATGLVHDEAARERVKRLLARDGVDAVIDIRTGPELARAAADVARMHGIPASARWQAGVLELHVPRLEQEIEAGLVQAVRRDVRGVGRVRLVDDLPPGDTDGEVRSVSDAAKRVATVVAGDPGYIQTVDGARYFKGATMPSGHVLMGIEEGTVVLARGGKTVRVTF